LTQHPTLYVVDVRCSSCGASFAVRSTAEAISTDVCSTCHPAYTGRERALASGSRIARFNRRRAIAVSYSPAPGRVQRRPLEERDGQRNEVEH